VAQRSGSAGIATHRAQTHVAPTASAPIQLIDEALYVPRRGRKLFEIVQQHDLEGIVAKRKADAYEPRAKWIKIKNPRYSRADGGGELFNSPKTARR
jgi:ATP-dependent DNA ligase